MQNIFPCTVMLLATGICAYLPVRAILNRCLSVREDVLFILFWYQSWIYLHLVPTINGLFPESTFAKPVRYLQLRVIQFTPEDIAWYAVFEVMILLLFYCPLLYFYGHFRKKKPGAALWPTASQSASPPGPRWDWRSSFRFSAPCSTKERCEPAFCLPTPTISMYWPAFPNTTAGCGACTSSPVRFSLRLSS